jgi:hypothetical protein
MSTPLADAAAEMSHARWKSTTAEERQAIMRKARLALAVKELVDQAPALSQDQRNKLRVILTQAPSGGGRDGR